MRVLAILSGSRDDARKLRKFQMFLRQWGLHELNEKSLFTWTDTDFRIHQRCPNFCAMSHATAAGSQPSTRPLLLTKALCARTGITRHATCHVKALSNGWPEVFNMLPISVAHVCQEVLRNFLCNFLALCVSFHEHYSSNRELISLITWIS